jgi:PAS domain S-box-containing protein
MAKKIEAKLKESEHRFHIMAEASGVSIFLFREKFLYANPAALQAVGYSEEEVQLLGLADILHPDSLAEVQQGWKARELGDTTPKSYEVKYVTKSGDIRWGLLHVGTAMCEGKPTSIGTVQDITERKKAEERLQLIAKAGARTTGVDFFRNVVRAAAKAMQVKSVFAAELISCKPVRAQSLAFWVDGTFIEDTSWELAKTACEKVPEGKVIFYPAKLQSCFPEDKSLVEFGAESYFCIPFIDSAGSVIGHMGVMDDKQMIYPEEIESLLGIFAVRAGSELERIRVDRILQQNLDKLQKFHRLAVGRELKMIELKHEINELLTKLGREDKYGIPESTMTAPGKL